jgi:hypothetical protein
MSKVNFPNYGYIIKDLDNDLFKNLKDECLSNLNNHKVSISGLTNTNNGIAKHYFLNYNKDDYYNFIYSSLDEYDKEFNYLNQFKILTKPRLYKIETPWINYQKETEYLPVHMHGGILSYSIWIKIPTKSKFQFIYNTTCLSLHNYDIDLDKSYEGKMIMFPSTLNHCVYPFYNCKEERISISGNIRFSTDD